jgi:hypothetical protein
MGITVVEPLAESVSYLIRFVASVTTGESSPAPSRALEGLPLSDLRLAAPHPVFNLETSAVVLGGNFETCRMTGWTYLVLAGSSVVATTGFAASHRDEKALHAYVGGRRMAMALGDAIGLAERSVRIRGGTFVLASIRLPALQAASIWLRDATGPGGKDWFVPILRTSEGFASGQLLDGDRWMRRLVRARQRFLRTAGNGE